MAGANAKMKLVAMVGLLCALTGCDSMSDAQPDKADPAARLSAAGALGADADCSLPREPQELSDQVLRLVNLARFGVGAVAVDPELAAIAEEYACTMITNGFFGHTDPATGVGLAERAIDSGYNYLAVGENLAAGIGSPQEVVDAWLASPTHRDIMLDPAFSRTGIAVRYGGENDVYWVQVFADPAD